MLKSYSYDLQEIQDHYNLKTLDYWVPRLLLDLNFFKIYN